MMMRVDSDSLGVGAVIAQFTDMDGKWHAYDKVELYCKGDHHIITACPPGPENSIIGTQ